MPLQCGMSMNMLVTFFGKTTSRRGADAAFLTETRFSMSRFHTRNNGNIKIFRYPSLHDHRGHTMRWDVELVIIAQHHPNFPPDFRVARRPSLIHPSMRLKRRHRQFVSSTRCHAAKTTKAAQESSAPLKTSNINDALFSTVLLFLPSLKGGVPKC